MGLFARGAIQCLADGQHIGVARGLLQEAHHHVEGFIGVVQKHVLLADGGEHVAIMVLNTFGHARAETGP